MAGPEAQSMSDIMKRDSESRGMDRTGITLALESVDGSLENAHQMLSKLEDKLTPLLRTDVDSMSDKRASDPSRGGPSDTQSRLWSMHERLMTLSDRMSIVMERVDL